MPVKTQKSKLKGDNLNLWELVQPCMKGQTLVFCQTKRDCEKYAGIFQKHVASAENADTLITMGDKFTLEAELKEVLIELR